MLFLTLITIFLILFGVIEYQLHLRNLRKIPIRININGTRGKSSVTRLIWAGLRAGNIKAVAKTTGASPRKIYEDDRGGYHERIIQRIGKANIKEQISITREFARHNPKASVIECMALHPILQKIYEEKLIKSTLGIITNVRPDHIDVMGESITDIAHALSNTVPKNGVLFTAEPKQEALSIFRNKAEQNNTRLKIVEPIDISDEELHSFPYFAWKDNIALALAACEHLGVPRNKALKRMQRMQPDPGALTIYRIEWFNKIIEFANAFAANDPESTVLLSKNLGIGSGDRTFSIYIVNCRGDKIWRSELLSGLLADNSLNGSLYVLTGEFTRAVYDHAVRLGQKEEKLLDLGGQRVEDIFEKVVEKAEPKTIVIGIGNSVGLGQEIKNYFTARGENEFESSSPETEAIFRPKW